MKLNYFGLLRSPVSWAKIGREITLAFLNNKNKVSIYERKGFNYNKDFTLPLLLAANIRNKFEHDRTLTFEYPLNYPLITSEKKYGMLVYETAGVPEKWAENINKYLDILFLPNEFNKKIFVDSGVREEIIRVVPYGINPEYYFSPKPDAGVQESGIRNQESQRKLFRFLCVAMPQKRKGIDVLIRAYEKAFGNDPGTSLTIKFPYKPGKSRYDLNLNSLKAKANIKIITEEFSEAQMGDLYRSCDSFVLASRAEGFGLIYLEALACGLPVIATGWGAHTEFLNENNSLLVKYTLRPAGEIQYDNASTKAEIAEPDVNDLAEKLIYVRQNSRKEKEKAGHFNTRVFYWSEIAEKMQGIIESCGNS